MTSANSSEGQASDLQRWYTGYLRVKTLPNDIKQRVDELARRSGFFDATSNGVEVEYKGRDTSGVVVRALVQLARLIQNADGEVRCEVSGDADELWFEFYRIHDGRLYRQRGEIVRHAEEEVSEG